MLLAETFFGTPLNWIVLTPVVLGFLAVVYLLPTPSRRPLKFTVLGVVAAVLGFGTFLFHGLGDGLSHTTETFLFLAFSFQAFTFAILMIVQRKPARAALFFAVVVLSVCGLFLLLAAPFLMAATIIIYAGAIIVTFLFVIMLSQQTGFTDANDRSREPSLAAASGFLMLAALLVVLQRAYVVEDDGRVAELLKETDRYASADNPVDELLQGTPTKAEVYFLEVQRTRDRLGYRKVGIPTHFNGVKKRESDSDPVEEIRMLLNLTETTFPPLSDDLRMILEEEELRQLKKWLAQLHFELAYLDAVRRGRVAPENNITLSPYGQSRPASLPDDPSKVEPKRLPNANIAALGRTLFTDHLLAVELGGTLLLVATIGAIAIAGGRREDAA